MGTRVHLETAAGEAEGYFSIPQDETGPAVVVLHDKFGLNGFIDDYVDQLAASGFVAIAPDLYYGRSTSDPAEADDLLDVLDTDRAYAKILAAAGFVLGREEATSDKYGVVGFGIGGALAQSVAIQDERVGAAVSYYGKLARLDLDLDQDGAPLLLFYGDQDDYVPSSRGIELQKSLRSKGREVDLVTLPVDYGFADPTHSGTYDEEAAEDAFNRTVEILRQTLPGAEVRARDY